jgi:microtubule-associated protein 9
VNSPRLSFLKTKKSNSDIAEDEPEFVIKNNEEMMPDGCDDMVVNSLSKSPSKDQEVEKHGVKIKPRPRILPIKSTPSGNSLDYCKYIS